MEGEEAVLSGYSICRGGATTAAQNEHVSIHQVIQQGGWTIAAVSTIFEYIAGTSHSDQKVAKVLAGWENPSSGGRPPSFKFAKNDNVCNYLFHFASKDWEANIHEHTCASLLMFLPETQSFDPENLLYKKKN